MKQKIINKFGKQILRRSALNLPNGSEDIQRFMSLRPVKNALEIGTFRGVTSAWMSQFCEELTTIDLVDGLYENYKDKIEWADTPTREAIWKELGITNIYFQPVKCNHSKERHIKMTDFDFAFIDGDHSYEGVKLDFNLVKHCGRVLFHDYDHREDKACPVRDFIHTIKDGKFEYTKDFAYWEAS